jgi:hypothetical protein
MSRTAVYGNKKNLATLGLVRSVDTTIRQLLNLLLLSLEISNIKLTDVFLKSANIKMRIISTLFSLLLVIQDLKAQSILTDTLPTTVNIAKFELDKKVVKAEYGKVIMYFNQTDYLGGKADADTIRITPKYFDDHSISRLLKEGKAKVWRRSTNSFINNIAHRLEQFGSMASRFFEFADGVSFFSNLEVIGIMGAYNFEFHDSSMQQKKDTVIQTKEFEYEEEFPNTKDTIAIKIKDYFPVNPSMYYVYDLNNDYGETDTNQCRSAMRQGQDIFYFAECYTQFPRLVSIGSTSFGSGLYFYRNDSLFTIETDYEKDIPEKEKEEAMLLLPSTMTAGDSSIIVDSIWNHRQVFTYLSCEDLTIKGTIHKDCIKIKILDYWDSTIYLSYVWLKKGTGLIKWMRATGHVDELINCFNDPCP